MKKIIFSLLIVLIGWAYPTCAGELLHKPENWIPTDKVILQGLDKVAGRVFTSEVYVNQKIHFGSLEIYIKKAFRSSPEDQPESLCFVEIFDNKQGQQRQQTFSGWMFASNPALSALEHPVYDIWIKEAVVPEEVLKERLPLEDIEEGVEAPSEKEEVSVKKSPKKEETVSLDNKDDDQDDGGF